MWGLGGEGGAECGEWQSFHLGVPRPGALSLFFASGFKGLMICIFIFVLAANAPEMLSLH